MKTSYDSATHSGYLKISSEEITKSIPVGDNLVLDFSADESLCGIEFIGISAEKLQQTVKSLQNSELKIA